MTAPRRNLASGIAAGLALAALAATPALAQAQDAARTLANGQSIVIDGRTFRVTPGTANDNAATPSEQRGARRLGAGVIIFRRGDALYMLDRPPNPPAAPAAGAANERPPVGEPRKSAADCGNAVALNDPGTAAPPDPNQDCQHAAAMERQRPHVPGAGNMARDDIEQMDGNPRIHIAYETPKDPAQQMVYDAIRQRHMLEMVRKIFSPFELGDIDLNIRTMSCGVSNAWYQRIGNVPTVSICYEYLQEIWENMPEETKALKDPVTMKEAVCGQLFFAVAHELGHAMFDIFDVPVFGGQEDAADQFATYIMLQFGGDQALGLIDGAAFGYHAFIKDLGAKPQVTLPLAAFSSDHGTPEQRYFNLICTAYGYDDRLFSTVMEKLPQSRARNCKAEYADLKFAMRTVFWPHLDHDKVKRVLAMNWFIDTGATARAGAIKAN